MNKKFYQQRLTAET